MPDWSASMQHTYEYYIVDPGSWKDIRPLNNVRSCTINRDLSMETLGSASYTISESIGECYVRAYLITIQNGVREKIALGTHLIQSPSSSFDGMSDSNYADAYTPLIELKENQPPIGYSLFKGANILAMASSLTMENVRAPVIPATTDKTLFDNFVATTDDTWLSFNKDLISQAKYGYDLDEMGRVLFVPDQDIVSLQPIWTYTDDNSSILYPDITVDRDLYAIPNVVEVVHSSSGTHYYARAINDDENSPVSTKNRGRVITRRVTDPDLIGDPTAERIQEYADRLLRELSSIECTISYKHGYCPVRLRDCVRLNYKRAGLTNIKAKVISQSIACEPGCPVTETAVFTTKLWR